MNEVLTAGTVMLGLAGFFGVVLALANRFLRVHEDPRLDTVEEMLPGTNCGACGVPGCRAFAETLVSGERSPGGCTVATPGEVEDIAGYLGVAAGFEEKRVARLHCAGGKSSVRRLAEYQGFTSCRAAYQVNAGGSACPWGCLGLGDCDEVCDFDAIHMNDEDLPVVEVELCTACNDCVEVCPVDLFTIEPLSAKLLVQCNNPLVGEAAGGICQVVCDGCSLCAKDAADGVIEMSGGLPVIRDQAAATPRATFRCPTRAIQWVEGNQFERREAVS